jgi:hypothetical protein
VRYAKSHPIFPHGFIVPDRFADRDMLMRYLWGFAVGHTYAHQRKHLVREGDSEQDKDEDQGVYDEEFAHDQGEHDGGCAQDQRLFDEECDQYPLDSDSASNCTDYLDEGDYDMD